MNQIDAQTVLDRHDTGASGRGLQSDGREAAGPALLFVPSHELADHVLAGAASSGFSHIRLGAPFRAPGGMDGTGMDGTGMDRIGGGRAGGGRASGGSEAIEARLGTLVARARAHGLRLVIDVTLDRLDTAGLLARAPGAPFRLPDGDVALDPRHRELPGVASTVMAGMEAGSVAAEAEALADWWGRKFATWQGIGVDGFCLHGLTRLPAPSASVLLAALRGASAGGMLIAWPIPGAPRAGLDRASNDRPGLDYLGLDCTDADALRRLNADRLSLPPLLGWPGEAISPSIRRRLLMAAMAGNGWVVPLRVATREPALVHELNHTLRSWRGQPRVLTGAAAPAFAVLRQDDALPRRASKTWLCLANPSGHAPCHFDPSAILAGVPGGIASFSPPLLPGHEIALAPAQARLFTAERAPQAAAGPLDETVARQAAAGSRIAVERPAPYVDGGRFPAKRPVGEAVTVEADVVFDGHDQIAVSLLWRAAGANSWNETRMRPLGNDRWRARFPLLELGRHEFQVEAWLDRFETWRDEVTKKHAAGVPIDLELREGVILIRRAAGRAGDARLAAIADESEQAGRDEALRVLLGGAVEALMRAADDRPFAARLDRPGLVDAERLEAGFAAWYEVFPRSLSDDPHRHGTFADVQRHLPRVARMGFDVLYFPPIHPIGKTNRKGRNNSLNPAPDDPGSPYAIGSEAGGHDALHPELGTLEDFRALVDEAARWGIEIAIDFAVQCSPDHPWLREHAGWFDWRPDGSIRYAENPPKKYQDIVNVDFYAEDAVPSLWLALCDVVLFWAKQGVRLFRVDNPHTKPFPFWEWLIGEVRARYPDSMFLAEAFTRPKIMARLAKVGFSQSYTYFTWRHSRAELRAYLEELAEGPGAEFYRPHFFVNTPDINPVFLQSSGRPGFLIRACLAATLSGLWGVYNGFELCEGAALPGREEYLDSEKYQLRAWDWDRPGNIVAEITRLNAIRRDNPALRSHKGVRFLDAGDDAVLAYEKASPDRSNVLLVVVSLDPFGTHAASVELSREVWGVGDWLGLRADDLIADGGALEVWQGARRDFTLTQAQPYRIFRLAPDI